MFKTSEPPVWASQRLIISMFGVIMISNGINDGPAPTLPDRVLPFIGGFLIIFSNAAWRSWKHKRDQEVKRLRTYSFSLVRIRNPAEEAAIMCGTPYPSLQLMLETLGSYLNKPLGEVQRMVGPGGYESVADMFDRIFPDEYHLEFRYDDQDLLSRFCILPHGGVRFTDSGRHLDQVRFPELTIDNDGLLHYGHKAVVLN